MLGHTEATLPKQTTARERPVIASVYMSTCMGSTLGRRNSISTEKGGERKPARRTIAVCYHYSKITKAVRYKFIRKQS